MIFNYSSITNATRKVAIAFLAIGLLLLGLGVMVLVLRAVFVIITSVLIFLAALWCISTAIRIFIRLWRTPPQYGDDTTAYRENVRVHNHNIDSDF